MKICGMCNDEGTVVVEDEMGLRHTAVCSWCGGRAPEKKAAQERVAKLQEENQRLRDALERAHDAINDLVPSGLDWDWWLVQQTGNDAHKGLHELIEKALKVQP